MAHPFSLLTINTWKCDGNYRQRLVLLIRGLAALQPDVIACQEVFRTENANTGRELAQALGMHYAFAPARHKPRLFEGQLTSSESGLALLSRYPIQQTDTLPLPDHPNDGDRLAQFVWLRANGASVLIVNTHLTHLRGQSELRKRQLATILAHLALTDPDQLVLLRGDFNADLRSEEIRFLLTRPMISARNAYTAGGGVLPGYTMIDRLTPAGSAPVRGRCIDFIFSLARHPARHPVIASARVVLDTPDAADNYPSDHCGVLIQTQIPTRDDRNPIPISDH